MKKTIYLLSLITLLSVKIFAQVREGGDPKLSEVWQPEPRVITPGKTSQDAPSDAIVLFNGKDLSQWQDAKGGDAKWKLKDGYVQVAPGTGIIQTRQKFGDCQLHIEWKTPDTVKGDGQGRAL